MTDAPRVHAHMTVSDLEKSRVFDERFLGTVPVKVKAGYVKLLPAFGPLNLALSQGRSESEQGHVSHMGVQIETREVVVRELPPVKRAGLAVGEEFGVSCGHANQDKVWVSDPDGVE
jgi:lactoylglutathione lyase